MAAPTWTEMAALHSDKLNIGRVDCTVDNVLCTEYEVEAYPVFIYLMGNKYYRY